VSKLGNLLNFFSSASKTGEDLTNVSTLLHRDDTKLIFLINPNEESLSIVMEDTTSIRPVTVETTSFKESITFLKEEMILDKLILNLRLHTEKRVVGTLEVTSEG
jgi:hypothetical protein